jgi:Family of unknown function (DUF5994)
MTTSPTGSLSTSTEVERVALRIRVDADVHDGPLDGAWWPQSRDLQREAADLVDHFPAAVGRVERLLFSRPDWDAVSGSPSMRRIQAERGPVKVGSFPSDDTHVMIVKVLSGRRLRLLVVPSDTEAGLAARVMEQAADGRNTRSPSALLGLSTPDQSGSAHTAWVDDAGHPA